MPSLEFYHRVFTLNISQMNDYCLIIPSARYFAHDSVLSDPSKLNFHKLKYVYVVLRLRGGGGAEQNREMGVAAGGLIDQSVIQDPGTHKWIPMQTKLFNVQILNTPNFQHVTGFPPPQPSIDARTFARYGYPFFSIYEEPTTVAGDCRRRLFNPKICRRDWWDSRSRARSSSRDWSHASSLQVGNDDCDRSWILKSQSSTFWIQICRGSGSRAKGSRADRVLT